MKHNNKTRGHSERVKLFFMSLCLFHVWLKENELQINEGVKYNIWPCRKYLSIYVI